MLLFASPAFVYRGLELQDGPEAPADRPLVPPEATPTATRVRALRLAHAFEVSGKVFLPAGPSPEAVPPCAPEAHPAILVP